MSLGYVPRGAGNGMMTEAQAQALAAFIGRVRPDWDHPGIMAALAKAKTLGAPAAIGAALCRLAENHEIRTPAILDQPGKHWSGTTVASRQAPVMCPDHPTEKASNCSQCIALAAEADHAAGVAAVKAALRNAPRPAIAAEPKPAAHDLTDARAAADQENPA